MSKTYDLRLRGKTYSGISLAEVKQIMSEVYTYAYIQGMVDKANVDTSPVAIEWIPGRNMNWIVDNVRMGRSVRCSRWSSTGTQGKRPNGCSTLTNCARTWKKQPR